MEDLLKTYQSMALHTNDYRTRNRHKHSTETPQDSSEDSFAPPECSYALGNTFD